MEVHPPVAHHPLYEGFCSSIHPKRAEKEWARLPMSSILYLWGVRQLYGHPSLNRKQGGKTKKKKWEK
uniref:Uncharacterized protein n=1 Tax=Physcomitrium patens TaxID=3218 RepID=A0A2K1JW23_PHYPA|nr:hypothetical protein PHYPA_015492 [Physcomitrium patens]